MSKPSDDDAQFAVASTALAAERARFLETIATLRPRLHHFCTRMTGSVFDGEDVVQDALAHAFFKLATLKDQRLLEPWLFRIAHNLSIDFLRQRRSTAAWQEDIEEALMIPTIEQELDGQADVRVALASALTHLPAKERACLVLKDVLGYSLEETAGIADSTVAGVKSALHRARAKLQDIDRLASVEQLPARERALLVKYVDRFNQKDWHGVRALLQADARLELVGSIDARGAEFIESRYFKNYAAISFPWRFSVCDVDGRPAAVMLQRTALGWQPHSVFRLTWRGDQVSAITDYIHVPYVLDSAHIAGLADATG